MQNKTNLEIKYKEFVNDNNSETIVILHGWGGSSDSWITMGELLSQNGFDVIIPDLPGFGGTKLDYVFTIDEYAKVISEFLKEKKINDFILWGHSNGGAIAIKIANSGNFKIKTLLLNNSAGIRNDKKRSLKRKIFNTLIKPIRFIGKIKSLSKIRNIFYRAIGSQDYLSAEKIPFLKETYQNMINSDLSSDIKNIKENTLLIRGELDTYTPLSDAYFMRENIANSKLVILNKEKHGIHLQNPQRLLKTFLYNI